MTLTTKINQGPRRTNIDTARAFFQRQLMTGLAAIFALLGTSVAAHESGDTGLKCETLSGGYSVCVYRSGANECIVLRGDEANSIECVPISRQDQYE